MKYTLLLTICLAFTANLTYAQQSKDETLKYINDVYKDSYCFESGAKLLGLSVKYQTLIVKFETYTITYSLKDSLTYFKMKDIRDGTVYWNIGKHTANALPGIRTEDDCKRLFRALLHLHEVVIGDPASKDPFDN